MNEYWKNRLQAPAFYVAILGAGKLVAQAFGYELITDEQVNAIANGFATFATLIGVVLSFDK